MITVKSLQQCSLLGPEISHCNAVSRDATYLQAPPKQPVEGHHHLPTPPPSPTAAPAQREMTLSPCDRHLQQAIRTAIEKATYFLHASAAVGRHGQNSTPIP